MTNEWKESINKQSKSRIARLRSGWKAQEVAAGPRYAYANDERQRVYSSTKHHQKALVQIKRVLFYQRCTDSTCMHVSLLKRIYCQPCCCICRRAGCKIGWTWLMGKEGSRFDAGGCRLNGPGCLEEWKVHVTGC